MLLEGTTDFIIIIIIIIIINAIKVDSLLRKRQLRTVHCTCYICTSSRYKLLACLLTSTQRKKVRFWDHHTVYVNEIPDLFSRNFV